MIDLDGVRKLKIQDGDLLAVPTDTDQDDMIKLVEMLRYLMPGDNVIVVRGPMERIDEATMNLLGWYRT